MIRGTTAQFKFKLPYKKGELEWVTIKFWQPGNTGTPGAPLPITKRLEHCIAPDDSEELCVSLTAEETLRFSDKFKAKVQLRAKYRDDGTIFASHEQFITVYPINDEIVNDHPPESDKEEDGWIILDGDEIISSIGGDD